MLLDTRYRNILLFRIIWSRLPRTEGRAVGRWRAGSEEFLSVHRTGKYDG